MRVQKIYSRLLILHFLQLLLPNVTVAGASLAFECAALFRSPLSLKLDLPGRDGLGRALVRALGKSQIKTDDRDQLLAAISGRHDSESNNLLRSKIDSLIALSPQMRLLGSQPIRQSYDASDLLPHLMLLKSYVPLYIGEVPFAAQILNGLPDPFSTARHSIVSNSRTDTISPGQWMKIDENLPLRNGHYNRNQLIGGQARAQALESLRGDFAKIVSQFRQDGILKNLNLNSLDLFDQAMNPDRVASWFWLDPLTQELLGALRIFNGSNQAVHAFTAIEHQTIQDNHAQFKGGGAESIPIEVRHPWLILSERSADGIYHVSEIGRALRTKGVSANLIPFTASLIADYLFDVATVAYSHEGIAVVIPNERTGVYIEVPRGIPELHWTKDYGFKPVPGTEVLTETVVLRTTRDEFMETIKAKQGLLMPWVDYPSP